MDRVLDKLAKLGRRKPFPQGDVDRMLETPLTRNLTTFNILFLCLGEVLGFGIFLVNGHVSKELAGPGTMFSFIFAAIIAIVPSVCYVEFGAKMPLTGSAYDYLYTTIGELVAFIVGWNLVLEFVVRAVSMAQMCSQTLDQLTGNQFEKFTIETFQGGNPWDYTYIVAYPDILGLLFIVTAIAIVNIGAKFTAKTVTILLICKYVVVGFSIYLGIVTMGEYPFGFQDGFLPNGWVGVIRGILPCFFAFTAFNALGTTCGEAKNPRKSIPLSVICFMVLGLITYILNSLSLNLAVSGDKIRSGAEYFEAFSETNYKWGEYMIGLGAVCTYFSSVVVNILFVSRLLLAICEDGLICSVVDHKTFEKRLAVKETISFGIVVGTTTVFIKFDAFHQFQSAGIICSLILVSIGIIILRYTPHDTRWRKRRENTGDDVPYNDLFRDTKRKRTKWGIAERSNVEHEHDPDLDEDEQDLAKDEITLSWLDSSELALMSEEAGLGETPLESELARLLPSSSDDDSHSQTKSEHSDAGVKGRTAVPTPGTLSMLAHPIFHPLARFPPGSVVVTCLITSLAFQIGHASVVSSTSFSFVSKGKIWALVQVFFLSMSLMSLIPIYLHHQRPRQKGVYEVPAVPTLPLISIFINILFVFQLPATTWIRSLVWLAVGLVIYVTYGYSHSSRNYRNRDERDVRYKIDCQRVMPAKSPYETVLTYQQLFRNPESE